MSEITKLRAAEAAHYLRLATSTLAELRCYRGGPRYSKTGQWIVIYDRGDLDNWLRDRGCNSTANTTRLRRAGRDSIGAQVIARKCGIKICG